eukprot:4015250-Pleurochrysis_carterae.AAC.1
MCAVPVEECNAVRSRLGSGDAHGSATSSLLAPPSTNSRPAVQSQPPVRAHAHAHAHACAYAHVHALTRAAAAARAEAWMTDHRPTHAARGGCDLGRDGARVRVWQARPASERIASTAAGRIMKSISCKRRAVSTTCSSGTRDVQDVRDGGEHKCRQGQACRTSTRARRVSSVIVVARVSVTAEAGLAGSKRRWRRFVVAAVLRGYWLMQETNVAGDTERRERPRLMHPHIKHWHDPPNAMEGTYICPLQAYDVPQHPAYKAIKAKHGDRQELNVRALGSSTAVNTWQQQLARAPRRLTRSRRRRPRRCRPRSRWCPGPSPPGAHRRRSFPDGSSHAAREEDHVLFATQLQNSAGMTNYFNICNQYFYMSFHSLMWSSGMMLACHAGDP